MSRKCLACARVPLAETVNTSAEWRYTSRAKWTPFQMKSTFVSTCEKVREGERRCEKVREGKVDLRLDQVAEQLGRLGSV